MICKYFLRVLDYTFLAKYVTFVHFMDIVLTEPNDQEVATFVDLLLGYLLHARRWE